MNQETGKLKVLKGGKSFAVILPTKKGGEAQHSIPAAAVCFNPQDAQDGIEVTVERDNQNRITRVTIPGKPEVSPAMHSQNPVSRSERVKAGPRNQQGQWRDHRAANSQTGALKTKAKASPKILGSPFHNPYTFIPFSPQPPQRRPPTPLSIDELPEERHRLTGVLELEVTTVTPLLSCDPRPLDPKADHKMYRALAIGNDVIVPATGIRGALRTLLTILTGGTLGYVNRHAYLCQGRDLSLDLPGQNQKEKPQQHAVLAKVIQPGSDLRPGRVQLGTTKLVELAELESVRRPAFTAEERTNSLTAPLEPRTPSEPKRITYWVGLDAQDRPVKVTTQQSEETPWQLRLSGQPIKSGRKREAVFKPDHREIELPPALWAEYSSRYAHGDRPVLEKGDLIWLELADPKLDEKHIVSGEQIRSIQWARLGRRGQRMVDAVPNYVLPDNMRNDGLVDEVTDLFGQVPTDRRSPAPSFAARVRPENLVFCNALAKVQRVTLAPLAPPHPGCRAFYRDNVDPDAISDSDPLRGYKVYRTTNESGQDAPWRYEVQGVYENNGRLRPPAQKVNKTCDLLPEGNTGRLRIAFRALTKRELALLLQACQVPWRLGGGKPLGLGACTVRVVGLLDELGEPLAVPGWSITKSGDDTLHVDGWQNEVTDLQGRVELWNCSQQPVAKLRYPRAAEENNKSISRGGHAWFQRHARPPMTKDKSTNKINPGLQPLHIDGELLKAAQAQGEILDPVQPMVAGQVLPPFPPKEPGGDVLYGYDGFSDAASKYQAKKPSRTVYTKTEPFDEAKHATGNRKGEGNQGKNRDFRNQQKKNRGDAPE